MLKKISIKNVDYAKYPKIDSKLKKYNNFYFNFKIPELNHLTILSYPRPASTVSVNNFFNVKSYRREKTYQRLRR